MKKLLTALAVFALFGLAFWACADGPEESRAEAYAEMYAEYEAERETDCHVGAERLLAMTEGNEEEAGWSAWSAFPQKEEIDYDAPLPQGIAYCDPDAIKASVSMELLGSYYITGYDACVKCCGKSDGITASGVKATAAHTVAMCKDFPFGTTIYIDGLGFYTVEDRGVGKGCVDVFCNDHSECYAITGYRDIYLITEGE